MFRKQGDPHQLSRSIQKLFHDRENEQDLYLSKDLELEQEDMVVGMNNNSDILGLIDLAASVTSSVLITGETGTGKNLLARSIHLRSLFRDKPFVTVNCAALPESLMEAELFGFEKGAFTSAVASKKGILEMANGGTFFLDEIGEIPLHLQSKLLNVLEEKTIRRLGSSTVKHLDFRILSSTSITLEDVLGSSFRKDLYYRLNVLRIHLPPLRNRRDDIPDLCRHFLKRMTSNSEIIIPDSELTKLAEYDWPGNVRELKNVLERAYIFQKDHVLRPSLIFMSHKRKSEGWDGKTERRKLDRRTRGYSIPETQPSTLAEIEKRCIEIALNNLGGNFTKIAKSLGISLSTLKRKVKEYGLRCVIIISLCCDIFSENTNIVDSLNIFLNTYSK